MPTICATSSYMEKRQCKSPLGKFGNTVNCTLTATEPCSYVEMVGIAPKLAHAVRLMCVVSSYTATSQLCLQSHISVVSPI